MKDSLQELEDDVTGKTRIERDQLRALLRSARALINSSEIEFRIPHGIPWRDKRDQWNDEAKKMWAE